MSKSSGKMKHSNSWQNGCQYYCASFERTIHTFQLIGFRSDSISNHRWRLCGGYGRSRQLAERKARPEAEACSCNRWTPCIHGTGQQIRSWQSRRCFQILHSMKFFQTDCIWSTQWGLEHGVRMLFLSKMQIINKNCEENTKILVVVFPEV